MCIKMPCCGFCRKVGHNKNSCDVLTKLHERLSQNATRDDFRLFSSEQLKIILQKALGTNPIEKYQNQIRNQLINIYVNKTGYHNLGNIIQPSVKPRERLIRSDEIKILESKMVELFKRHQGALPYQHLVERIPSNISLYNVGSMEKKECPICYTENITNCETDCQHSYCLDCISSSLKYKPSCAVCRNNIKWMGINISENKT